MFIFKSSRRQKNSIWVAPIFVFWCFAAFGQAVKPVQEWTHLAVAPLNKTGMARWVQPLRGELFQLDNAMLQDRLTKVATAEPSLAKTVGSQIELPMPDGKLARFIIVESSVMAPELAAKFPEIKTYAGQGLDDPAATVRLDVSPLGFHAQVLSPSGAVYVDPAYRGDTEIYVSYYKRDYQKKWTTGSVSPKEAMPPESLR